MDIVEKWRESILEESRVEVSAGAALVGLGLFAGLLTVLQRRRGFLAWAIPGAIISGGLYMLSDVVLDVRSNHIRRTESAIQEELETLDPLARAQVLKRVGEGQMRSLIPGMGQD